jgi:hypothetical protein
MRRLIFSIFNMTVGKIIRFFQAMLITPNFPYSPPSVLDLINQHGFQDSAEYALSHFSKALQFKTRLELWSYCLSQIPSLQTGGVIAEFGVWEGKSINFFARNCPKARVYGFDSFEGLEEDWYGHQFSKGHFSTGGKLPRCESNVILVKGWFEDTLPQFCYELQKEKILLLHMDADTYKPTTYVLNSLSNNLGKGTIIIFDEYFGYTNFRLHEFKAWQELVKYKGLEYRYIGYTDLAVAVEIL